MGQAILVSQQIEAGKELLCRFNEFYPVSSACWVSPSESEQVVLYIASDEVEDRNIHAAYTQVAKCVREICSPWLDPFQIKLVNSSNDLARDAASIRDRGGAPIDTWFRGTSLGSLGIDFAYIYAPLSASKSTR